MFSPLGAPTDDQEDINWLDDLKFFIDNDDQLLANYLFPAVKKHKEYKGNPNVFKLYVKPVEKCLEQYCQKFEIENAEEKFPKDKLIELARKIAEEQEQHLENDDYEIK